MVFKEIPDYFASINIRVCLPGPIGCVDDGEAGPGVSAIFNPVEQHISIPLTVFSFNSGDTSMEIGDAIFSTPSENSANSN